MTAPAAVSDVRPRLLDTLVGLGAVLIWSAGGPIYTFVSEVPRSR